MTYKSCFLCKHSTVYNSRAGAERYQPDKAECKCKDVLNKRALSGLDEDDRPDVCGKFEQPMVAKCTNCGKEINEPEWSWSIWAYAWDILPCCSDKCKEELEYKFKYDKKPFTPVTYTIPTLLKCPSCSRDILENEEFSIVNIENTAGGENIIYICPGCQNMVKSKKLV